MRVNSLKIVYKPSTSVTGKQLRDELRLLGVFSKVLKVVSHNKKIKAKYFLRWGDNRDYNVSQDTIQLNTKEAVNNAVNKYKMLTLLSQANVPTLEFTRDFSQADNFKDENGVFYVRGSDGEVRYDTSTRAGDSYISKPILNKKREYRVHVFNGKVIAIYEKIPNIQEEEEKPKLFKSYNCHFSLCDVDNCRIGEQGKQAAINAVSALGLLFGGVDVIYTYDKHKPDGEKKGIIICEVNSAPSLNTTNIGRWVESFKEYCYGIGV
jgi:glutathione synthase/RimK-type ligase-like ATP-grasp enzyme